LSLRNFKNAADVLKESELEAMKYVSCTKKALKIYKTVLDFYYHTGV
jgi:hypothetical protein